MRFCPQLAVPCPLSRLSTSLSRRMSNLLGQRQRVEATTRHCGSDSKYPLWPTRPAPSHSLSTFHSALNSRRTCLRMSDPTRSLREHFRHHRTEQEKERRSELSPNTWNTPFVTDALLPFCSFIAILHAQSADLADYADYGKYTQAETYTHTHTYS